MMPTPGGMGATASDAMQPALHRVAQLADLPPDWDSYGADPPSSQAVARAYELLLAVKADYGRFTNVQPYTIAPLDDGGLQIEWRGSAAEIEVEIDPAGGLGYLFIDKSATERSFHERDDADWPEVMDKIARTLPPRHEGDGVGTNPRR